MPGIIFAVPKIGDFPIFRMGLRTIFDEPIVSLFDFSYVARRLSPFGREESEN